MCFGCINQYFMDKGDPEICPVCKEGLDKADIQVLKSFFNGVCVHCSQVFCVSYLDVCKECQHVSCQE